MPPGAALRTFRSGAASPVIPGFFPDPTICRVGDDYYLATSSFEYFPGAPLFHSRDLQEWNQVGNILTRRSQFSAGDRRGSGGIFGSTLRHHGGRFWFVTTNMSDFGGGHLLLSAEDPAGPWSDPVQIPGTLGIDPDIAWDDDDGCFLTWVGFGPAEHQTGIVQARLDPVAGELLEVPRKVWQGSGLAYPEGPHLYHVGDWWYLLLAEGGTERGHSVSISRSAAPQGPFEGHRNNPIFSHRSLDATVQNAGHPDLLETVDGNWAAVYLGVRQRGTTPSFHVLGRETFLAGISWSDGWPQFHENHYEVPVPDTSFSDDFSAPELHHRWVSPGDDPASFTDPTPNGLAISGTDRPDGRRRTLATRVRDFTWSAGLSINSLDGATVRLELRVDDGHWYAVEADEFEIRAVARIGQLCQTVGRAALDEPASDEPAPDGRGITDRTFDPELDGHSDAGVPLVLEIQCTDAPNAGRMGTNAGPDEVSLGIRRNGLFTRLASLDGRYLSTEVAGGFTGRVLGISATNGTATVRRFEYLAPHTRA